MAEENKAAELATPLPEPVTYRIKVYHQEHVDVLEEVFSAPGTPQLVQMRRALLKAAYQTKLDNDVQASQTAHETAMRDKARQYEQEADIGADQE